MKVTLLDKYYIGDLKVKIRNFVIAAAVAITNMAVAQAGDPQAASNKAETLCAGCHGPDGISSNPLWPNLAGQKEQYLIKVLKDFQEGIRPDPTMEPLANTLTDREIEDLAAYYAKL